LLIIFDLDDTLIDTSGCVTPFKLREVLTEMLGFCPPANVLDALTQLDGELCRSKEAIETIGKRLNLSEEAIERGLAQLVTPLPDHFRVNCTPGAKEILEEIQSRCPIALVTVGYPPFQLDKLKKAGIEASIFSKIVILGDSVKKTSYKNLAEEFSVAPSDVWVCGDRIPVDLMPAYELQFNTVHMRWGRGKKMALEPWIDHTISGLTELRNIIR